LEVLQKKQRDRAWTAPLVRAFSRPEPRFVQGRLLARHDWATSLMDCSDGLEASARLLAEASGVGVELDLRQLPASAALARWAQAQKKPAWSYALQGGEDYELIFTTPAARWPRLHRALPQTRVIGRVRHAREKITALTPDGARLPLEGYGFAHFKK
jgi:thiamine-monophosphate kinase